MNLPISCPVNQSTSFICGFFLIVLLENKTKAFKTLEPKSGRSTQCNGCPVEPMIFVGGGSKITGWSPMSEYPRKATPMLGSPVLSLSTVILNKPSEPTWIRSSLCPHPTPSRNTPPKVVDDPLWACPLTHNTCTPRLSSPYFLDLTWSKQSCTQILLIQIAI